MDGMDWMDGMDKNGRVFDGRNGRTQRRNWSLKACPFRPSNAMPIPSMSIVH